MAGLHVSLLGGFDLDFDGEILTTIKTQKAKALFAYLMMHPEKLISRTYLATLLWPEQPAEKAAHNLRQALSNLRKGIPQFAEFCQVDRFQVLCNKNSQLTLDVTQFEQFSNANDERHLALKKYNGPFLNGFFVDDSVAFETWMLGERERIQAIVLSLLETLSQEALQQNQYDESIKYLNQLIEVDSWHELAYQNLMLIFARQGDFNRSLALFKKLTDVLHDGLHVAPMDSTVKLIEKIRAARQSKNAHRLPNLAHIFVGRDAESHRLKEMLTPSNSRLITIIGPGGVGKSRIALHVAQQLQTHFLNGVYYISLAALNDFQLISREIATAVAFKAQHTQNFDQQLITFLNNREMLLILDNFEHLLAGGQLIATLLQKTSDIKLIITSREALNLHHEQRFFLKGLSFPSKKDDASSNPSQFDSYQLFIEQANKIDPYLQPNSTASEILEICQLLEGIPLGLELAAAQLETQTVPEILTAIQNNFNSLQKEWGDRPERHHSLKAVFTHSWNQLNKSHQTLLGKLSVFQGSFNFQAAEQIGNAKQQDLNQLLNKSLLRKLGDKTTRYDLHPIVQQYAAESLDPSDIEQARHAYTNYYLEMVTKTQQAGGYAIEQLEETTHLLSTELDNIRQAWRLAILTLTIPQLADALVGMSKLYAGQSWFREGATLYSWSTEQLVGYFSSSRSLKETLFWGHLHGYTAGLFLYLSEIQIAKGFAENSIDILQSLQAPIEQGYAWNMLGISQLYAGDFAASIDALEKSLQFYKQTESDNQMLGPLVNLGSVYQRVGEYDKGLHSLMDAFAISQKINDRRGSAHLLNNIGGILFSLGRFEEASDYFKRCNQLCEETGYAMVRASALLNLAELEMKMGTLDQDKIVEHLALGLQISEKIEDKQKMARAHKLFADYWLLNEAFEQAQFALIKGLQIVWEVKALPTVFELLLGFSTYYIATNQENLAKTTLTILTTHSGVPQHIQHQATALVEKFQLSLPNPLNLEQVIDKVLQ